jgi:hypothetical protein
MLLALEGIFLDILHDNDLNGKVIGLSDLIVESTSSRITRPLIYRAPHFPNRQKDRSRSNQNSLGLAPENIAVCHERK